MPDDRAARAAEGSDLWGAAADSLGCMTRRSEIPGLAEYLTRHAGQDEVLARVDRETQQMPMAQMQLRPDQGALLTVLARAIGARQAIEVGTFTGYSGICIARGLRPDGHLTCLELNPDYAAIAQRNLEAAGMADRVTIELGPAERSLLRIPARPHFDLAFLDADKGGYPTYYDLLVPRLRAGGLLVIDNTLLGGDVIEPQDERTRAMDALNARIAGDERVDSALLGLAGGMTVARRRATAGPTPGP